MSNIQDTTVQVNSAFNPDETLRSYNSAGDLQEKKTDTGSVVQPVAAQKRSQVKESGCNAACTATLGVALVAILVAFVIVLVLYVREKDDSTTSFETCLEEECIVSAAGKMDLRLHCYIIDTF